MAKPLINNINAMESSRGATITFSLMGEQSYGNKIWIYDTLDLSLVYEYPKNFKLSSEPVPLSCAIPANLLVNGSRYFCQIQCLDKDGVPGSMSEKSVFYCLATPELRFTDVIDGQRVDASYLNVRLSYYQANGEKLQSYRFGIYDKNKLLINESELFFYASNSEMTYRYKGLATGHTYYVRATGYTAKGLQCDTGLVEIRPEYTLKKDFSQINLENKYYQGIILVKTSIVLIGYELNSDDYLFVNGEAIDLTGRNLDYLDVLEYKSGFVIDGDFTAWLKLYGSNMNTTLLTFSNELGQEMTISAHRYDGYVRYKLTVSDGVTKYIRYTEPVVYSKTKYHTVYWKREGHLFDFRVFDGTQTEQGDYTLYQNSEGQLFVSYAGPMPAFRYVEPSLYYSGDDILRYDSNTGNLYRRV